MGGLSCWTRMQLVIYHWIALFLRHVLRMQPKISSGIHGGLTYGYGKLDYNGYWQFQLKCDPGDWEWDEDDIIPLGVDEDGISFEGPVMNDMGNRPVGYVSFKPEELK